jgi:hypothetical protein
MQQKSHHVMQVSATSITSVIRSLINITQMGTHALQQWRLTAGIISMLIAVQATHAVQITQGTTDSTPSLITAPLSITNNDTGVTYSSLKLDSGLADLIFSAYGVSDLYNNNFQDFLSSGHVGYNISSGSQVQNNWFTEVNSDSTISLDHFGGENNFNTDKTMTGNYFFLKDLLDADGDGKDNYTFHLLSDAELMPNFSSPLTKQSIVGSSLDGDFLQAYTIEAGDPFAAQGQAYALVPTDYHPQIPEPSRLALFLGLGTILTVFARKRHQL